MMHCLKFWFGKYLLESRLLRLFRRAYDKLKDSIKMVLKDIQKTVKKYSQSDKVTVLNSVFSRKKTLSLKVAAEMKYLKSVLLKIRDDMGRKGVSVKGQFNMIMAAEEVFANIVSYAYEVDEIGDVEVDAELEDGIYSVTFKDKGKKYNPLKNKNPDVTVKIEDRDIGGLGVFLAKKVSDTITYAYDNGYNVLRIGVKVDKS